VANNREQSTEFQSNEQRLHFVCAIIMMCCMNSLLVFLGGGIGATARYGLQGAVYKMTGAGFPYGTLVVNVLGSFLIGLLITSFGERFMVNPSLRVFLTIGILGGFTTFSSFSYETMALLRDGSYMLGLANIALSVVVCLGATWIGIMVGKLL
jgi:CrcB protein